MCIRDRLEDPEALDGQGGFWPGIEKREVPDGASMDLSLIHISAEHGKGVFFRRCGKGVPGG